MKKFYYTIPKLFFIIITLLILYYKTYYSLFIILLFYQEYFYFLYFFYFIKSTKSYNILQITNIDISDLNNIDIWILYCKSNAYLRLYSYLQKNKKVSLKSLIWVIFIYIFHIPYKFLKLSYFFIFKNKKNFINGLMLLTLENYNAVKDLKIEILKKNIYLNCQTIGKLSHKILEINEFITKKAFIIGMESLKNKALEFKKIEDKFEKEEVNLSIFYDENDKIFAIPHYGICENKLSLHSTSNINFKLRNNQRTDGIIEALTKNNAIKPGTVITNGITKIEKFNKSIFVPKNQLDAIRMNYEQFYINNISRNYQLNKEFEFKIILQKYFFLNKNVDLQLLRDFRYNTYNSELCYSNKENFEELYKLFKNDV